MIKIVGTLNNKIIIRTFDNVFDATEFRDELDAQYAKIEWIQV